MPKRIQRKRTKGWRMPENAIYVGRPSKWGNSSRVGDSYLDFSEKGNIKSDIVERIIQTPQEAIEYYRDIFTLKLLDVKELRGKDLACWCKLCDKHRSGKPLLEDCQDCDPCHADVIGKILYGNTQQFEEISGKILEDKHDLWEKLANK